MKVLFIQQLKFGDVAQSLPAVWQALRGWPEAEVHVLTRGRYGEILGNVPCVHLAPGVDYVTADDHGKARRVAAEVVAQLPTTEWDLAVNLSHTSLAGHVLDILEARRKAGMAVQEGGRRLLYGEGSRYLFASVSNRRLSRINLVDVYRSFVGKKPAMLDRALPVRADEQKEAAELLRQNGWDGEKPLVVLQLGAAQEHRIWPPQSFATLADKVDQVADVTWVLIGSPDERALADAFLAAYSGGVVDLVGCSPMRILPALFSLADLLIGSDTGPLHVAAMTGLRTVGLYFSTSWLFETGPWGADHWILQTVPSCAPCLQRTLCPEVACRRGIAPEDVLQAVLVTGILTANRLSLQAVRLGPDVRLYRSVQDAEGTTCYRWCAGQTESEQDLLARAYGAFWRRHLGLAEGGRNADMEIPPTDWPKEPQKGWTQTLVKMAEKAEEGEKVTRRILQAAMTGPKLGVLNQLGARLDTVHGELRSLGAPGQFLTSYLDIAHQTMPAESLIDVAKGTLNAYGTVRRGCRAVLDFLRSHGERTEKDGEPEAKVTATAKAEKV